MTLDRDTLLEAAERIDALKVDKARCRVLMLTEQAWEEAQYQCSAELRALAAEQPENSQQVGIVQVLPLVPQPSTVTTVTPDPVAQEVKIKDASLSRTPETDAIDATADQNYGTDMYSDMLGHARRKEREVAYWKHEFYRVERMVLSEQDRVEELERQLAAAQSRLNAAKEAVREAAIKECERWPLDPNKMEDSLRWAKVGNGVGNAIAGTCNALSARIRALDLSKLSADKEEK